MSEIVGAVDPGIEGAIAWLCGDEANAIPTPWIKGQGPDVERFRSWVLTLDRLFIEELGVRPGQSVQATKTAAINWGRMEGIAIGSNIKVEKPVRPQAWRKLLGLPNEKDLKKRKAASVALCQRLFPSVSLIPEGCKVPHNGMAEALLLAEVGRRTLGGC